MTMTTPSCMALVHEHDGQRRQDDILGRNLEGFWLMAKEINGKKPNKRKIEADLTGNTILYSTTRTVLDRIFFVFQSMNSQFCSTFRPPCLRFFFFPSPSPRHGRRKLQCRRATPSSARRRTTDSQSRANRSLAWNKSSPCLEQPTLGLEQSISWPGILIPMGRITNSPEEMVVFPK